ncbi:MAG: SMP-30/gluconolactonase/LRE family protein [Woeseiaceae bacterium]|nr:SMP-30/gluconolactonase/LRE family protein [Woeseiaceae bacterium]
MQIEVLVDLRHVLGEGPQWDVKTQRLYWIDSFKKRIYRATADGRELKAWKAPEIIGSICLTRQGSALVAGQTGLFEFDFDSEQAELIFAPKGLNQDQRLNDGKVDRNGHFFFGGMDMTEKAGLGKVYLCDKERRVQELDTGFVVFNGPCWSPDGKTFYASDSSVGKIWRYDHDPITGALKNKVAIVSTDHPMNGSFDGCTVDEEGCLWSARIFGGRIDRYSPDGALIQSIDMPIKKPTSVAFGGPDLNILYVTSMGAQLSPDHPKDNYHRGALFAITDLGVRGIEEKRHDS